MTRQGAHLGSAREPLRKRAPHWAQHWGRAAALGLGRVTAGARCTPDFVLCGAQRSGTTSLFRALMQHPQVVRPTFHKGVNYFDLNYPKGQGWYAGHFPLRMSAHLRTHGAGTPSVFEASGYYLFHPLAMHRLLTDLPGVKVLVMLRDPVERAFSAYKHEVARGFETQSFETAVDLEHERLAGEVERMLADAAYSSWEHRHHGYVGRGQYAEQLERALEVLPRDALHLIESIDFFTNPATVFRGVTDFLGLAAVVPRHFDQYNARRGSVSPETRTHLVEHYRPYDERLAMILGSEPSWRRPDAS